jgi:hypothetical protein
MKAHCLCVPVPTYRGLGTTKSGVNASDHVPLVAEGRNTVPVSGEQPIRPAIHVIVENTSVRVSTSARIDFSRLYTVEYNYVVKTVGRIHARDMDRLKQYAAQLLLGDRASQISNEDDESSETVPSSTGAWGLEGFQEREAVKGRLSGGYTPASVLYPGELLDLEILSKAYH